MDGRTSAPTHMYEAGLGRTPANFSVLSPLGFLERSASVYPDHVAIVHGAVRRNYADFYARARRLASALAKRGIGLGDTVSAMLPNIPAMLEAHYGVPMIGAVLNALNIRLDADSIAFMLQHCEAKVLLTDREFSGVIRQALQKLERKPLVIDVHDDLAPPGDRIGEIEYEAFIAAGDPAFAWQMPADEYQAISVNYTSGTTGNPKGAVYPHRGVYLNALGNAAAWAMPDNPVYLWTLPMFHCNGWCFPWTITAYGGTHVCLRRVEAKAIYDLIAQERVTHMCAAPIVLNMMMNAKAEEKKALPNTVHVMTAGSAPPAAVIEGMENQGFDVLHVYGLTEVLGPAVVCSWHKEWDTLPVAERAALKARQGVRYQVQEGLMVADPQTLTPVPADGVTMGEVFMRGNIVMRGYLKNPAATEAAFAGGWFHTGDLAVCHADGYIELKDRSKDIIISGGENISTIEVESVLYRHPAVLEAAVVARPDAKWGETPCAFVTLKEGAQASADDIIAHCRTGLAHFKAPRSVVFGPLPKTSTGKIQKFVLRDRAKALS